MKSFVFFATIIAAWWVQQWGVVGGQDAGSRRCVEELFSQVAACFTNNGLSLTLHSGQQDATKLMRETQAMDPQVQCRNLTSYKRALNCSLGELGKCLDLLNMGGSIPNSRSFLQGMEAVCARQQEFDSECLKSRYPSILRCGEETLKEVVQQRSDRLTMEEIICMSADVNYDCSNVNLLTCGKNTHEIYLEQLSKYQVPAACVHSPPGRQGRRIYVSDQLSGAGSTLLGGLAAASALLLHLLLLH